jgi:hypothetical protein
MWPTQVLSSIGPVIFHGTDHSKLKTFFEVFVRTSLTAEWSARIDAYRSLMDFRDFVEDTWTLLKQDFGVSNHKVVSTEDLVRALKATSDGSKRKSMTLAFLQENVLSIRNSIQPQTIPVNFVEFSIQKELDIFFQHAKQIHSYRPILNVSVEVLESIVGSMESKGLNHTLQDFQEYARNMNVTTLWPVLALWYSLHSQDPELSVERLFINVPLPRVFGAPSAVRNSIDRHCDPSKLCKSVRERLSLSRAIIAGSGYLAWRPRETESFIVVPAPTAILVAPLPGLSKRFVWTLDPKTHQAAIYNLDLVRKLPDASSPLESKYALTPVALFEIPYDETDQEPNWIDCQRDAEGSLVLRWGHINALTGGLHTQNLMAFDEEALYKEASLEFLDTSAALQDRYTTRRIDWRDHGNLLSMYHSIEDHNEEPLKRRWVHNYEIVFGSSLLMTMSTDARPIESIYGSPEDVILLSPLSTSSGLQHFVLDQSTYTLKENCSVPKIQGYWNSVCVL